MSGTRVILEGPGRFDYGSADLRAEWKIWKRGFNSWLIGSEQDGKKESVKTNLLLTFLGSEGQDIYETFDQVDEQPKLAKVLEQFDSHFAGLSNITMTRFRFFSFTQGHASAMDFVTGLKKLANDCEFGDLRDSLIKDMVVIHCKCEKLRERLLLKEPKLDLIKTVEIARIAEEAERDVDAIGRGSDRGNSAAMMASKTSTTKRGGRTSFRRPSNFDGSCFECGEYGHKAQSCPERKVDGGNRPRGHESPNSNKTSDQRKSYAGYAASFALSATVASGGYDGWYVDSGASHHMTPDRDDYDWYEPYRRPCNVTLGDGRIVRAYGQGEMKLRVRAAGGVAIVMMKEVQLVPKLKMGLLSVPATTRLGNEVSFQRQASVVSCGSLRLRCPVNEVGLYEVPALGGEPGGDRDGYRSRTGSAASGGMKMKPAHQSLQLNARPKAKEYGRQRNSMCGLDYKMAGPQSQTGGAYRSQDYSDSSTMAGWQPRFQEHPDLWTNAGGQGYPGASTQKGTKAGGQGYPGASVRSGSR